MINKKDYPPYEDVCSSCEKEDCKGCKVKHHSSDFVNRKTITKFNESDKPVKEMKQLVNAYLDTLPNDTKATISIETTQWLRYAKQVFYMDGSDLVLKEYESI